MGRLACLFAAALTVGACHTNRGVFAPEAPLAEQLLYSADDYEQEPYGPTRRLGAPGFDVAWLGAREPRHVALAEGAAFVVDADGEAFGGPDFAALKPLGFTIPESASVRSDGRALYWFTSPPALWRGGAGSPPERLWTGPGDVDKLRQDGAALYALFLHCRACATDHSAELWRFPKAGGVPALLLRTHPDQLVTEFASDETSLLVSSIRSDPRGTRLVVERVPVLGGPPVEVDARMIDLIAIDDRYLYGRTSAGIARMPVGGGAPVVIAKAQADRSTLIDDGRDFFFLEGTRLTAAPMRGGALRLLADFEGDPSFTSSCSFCGHSLTDVCVRCDQLHAAVYRVPKAPRAAARLLAHDSGEGLAVSDRALLWTNHSTVVRRDVDANSDDARTTELAREQNVVSTLVADGEYVYYELDDGGVRRVPLAGGPSQTVAERRQKREGPRSSSHFLWTASLARALAIDGDSVVWIDDVLGMVLRAPKAGGPAAVLLSGLHAPAALVGDGKLGLSVVSATPNANQRGADKDWRVTRLDAAHTVIGSVRLPDEERPGHAAMTSEATYLSFSSGIARLPRGGGPTSIVFPTLVVAALTADEHALYFSTPGQIMVFREGDALPTVLASNLMGTPDAVVRHGDGVYFTTPLHFKWEKWSPLGVVRAGGAMP